ncbi:MAG: tetratricopeptide repeat protein, partial [Deltaproteobacteria bacterium]|nr:tetratricopeptide repeat protein [Deltaproteobacteria bacterium]
MNEWVSKGEELFAQGRMPEALSCFQTAVEQVPDDGQAWNDLAVVCLELGREDEAVLHFRQAIHVQPNCLDAQANLADYFIKKEMWPEAAETLERAIRFLPDSIPILQRLALAYKKQGRTAEYQKLVDGSRTIQLMRSFIDALWSSINYWELAEGLTVKERLEGVVGSCLAVLDGEGSPNVHFKILAEEDGAREPVVLEWLHDHLYYQMAESHNVQNIREHVGKVLEIGPNPDWEMFRPMLFHEIKYEGSCLGDFTHTKKLLRRETAFRKYDVAATLDYFRENVGPCDCHVFKGSYKYGEGALFYEQAEMDEAG